MSSIRVYRDVKVREVCKVYRDVRDVRDVYRDI